MDKIILVANKEECCGCSACEALCPTGAISMNLDEDGFYYPIIDEKKCKHCHQCIGVCIFRKKGKQE